MLTKTKSIRKNIKKNFSKIKKTCQLMDQGKQQPKLKEILALSSEIIATRTDDERTDGRPDDGQISISRTPLT